MNDTFRNARAPTTDEDDADVDVIKHKFNEELDIPPFIGSIGVVLKRNGRTVYERKRDKDRKKTLLIRR